MIYVYVGKCTYPVSEREGERERKRENEETSECIHVIESVDLRSEITTADI